MVAEPRDSGEAPGRAGPGRVTDSPGKARFALDMFIRRRSSEPRGGCK